MVKILKLCEKFEFIKRPKYLSKSHVEKHDARKFMQQNIYLIKKNIIQRFKLLYRQISTNYF